MKYIITSLALLTICGCQTDQRIDPVNEYILKSKEQKLIIPMWLIDEAVISEYETKIPYYKELKSEHHQALQKVLGIIEADSEYQAVHKAYMDLGAERTEEDQRKYKKQYGEINRRMWKDETYAHAQRESGRKAYVLNMMTFEYIVNDYKARGKEIPKAWCTWHWVE